MVHSLKDANYASVSEQIDPNQIFKNKVVIAEPNSTLDISTDE